jgi:hypothetical protein
VSRLLLLFGRSNKPDAQFNFMGGSLDPRITFTRTSVAWYMNGAGLLTQAAINEPRFDYDYTAPGAPTLRGLLIGSGSTNEALHSRDLTNAAWTKSNVTAAKDETGIDGAANSASSLLATAGNATCLQAITSPSSTRTLSVYIKRLAGSGNIDLTLDNGATWTTVPVTSSWTRVAVSQAAVTNPTIGIRIVTSGDKIAVDVVQEEKKGYATSPIVTTTAAVAVGTDNAIVSGTNFSSWFNASAGTVLFEYMIPVANISSARIGYAVDDGVNSNESYNWYVDAGAGVPRYNVVDGGVSQVALNESAPSINTLYKAAMVYAAGDFASSLNGATAQTDASGTLPTVTQLRFGSRHAGASYMDGWVRKLSYWNRRLLNAQIQALAA